MRWWSLFQSQRSLGWVPVSNTDDDPDETGMDDLMRMANGYYQDDEEEISDDNDSGSSSRSNLPLQRGRGYTVNGTEDDDQPVFCRAQSSIWSSVVGLARGASSTAHQEGVMPAANHNMPSGFEGSAMLDIGNQEGESPPLYREHIDTTRRGFCRHLRSLNFPPRRWHFIFLSIVIALVFIGLNVGLGVYSLVFYNPDQLVIDKSVKSFSIPNHKAYRNFEALMMARKDNSSNGRYRRDSVAVDGEQSLWGRSNIHSSRRLRREALLVKEEKMLKHTASVLRKLNLKYKGFTQKAKDILPPSLFSSKQTSSTARSGVSSLDSLFHRSKRSSHQIDCMFDYQSIARWKMHVIYLAQGDEELNMFTKERLKTAHEIEQRIIQHPNFNKFCLRDPHLEMYDPAVRGMNGCVPLNSLLTYFFPSVDTKGNVYYDGLGTNIDDVDSALKLAMNHETFYYYVDDKINKTYQKSYLLRSEVLFGAPLAGYSCIGTEKKDQDDKFKEFVVTYIDLLSKASTDKVQVLYGGNEIFDYEVSTTFWGDVHLAMVSLIAIFVLMLLLSLSLYLTILGVVVISLSFPMSLFFYRVVFGINALGILNGAAAFVIIGIGVDDVFVFVNIYRQASHMKDPAARILYTLRTAGVATFFTSFTTAAAFAANLASAIPAVYEFGLFMSLIVSSCWLSVFVLMPPMLYLHACCFEPLEKMLFSCFSCSRSEDDEQRAESAGGSSAHNLSLQQYHRQQEAMGRGLYPDDGDVPMLDIADDIEASDNVDFYNGVFDDEMLIDDPQRDMPETGGRQPVLTIGQDSSVNYESLDDMGCGENPLDYLNGNIVTTTASNRGSNNNMCLGRIIQRCLMFLTNRVVIRGRYFVVAFYFGVLLLSCLLMTRLRPSTHPPQLFRPNTNIQQLLDLKANFSIIDTLHCDRCSGLYKVHGSQAAVEPDKPEKSAKSADPAPSLPSLIPPPPPLPTQDVKGLSNATDRIILPPSSLPAGSGNSDSVSGGGAPGNDDEGEKTQVGSGSSLSGLDVIGSSISQLFNYFQNLYGDNDLSESKKAKRAQNSIAEDEGKEIPPPPPSADRSDSTQGASHTRSVDENFDVCADQSCNNLKDRPLLESGATVYVVMGIVGLQRSKEDVGHVLDQFNGRALFDPKFAENFDLTNLDHDHVEELCKVCHYLANQTDLVRPDSAQCLPSGMHLLHKILSDIPACQNLPGSQSTHQYEAPAHAEGGWDENNRLLWLAFAFESTTSEGQAYFQAYKQYEKWQEAIMHIKREILAPDSPLTSIFQTSEFWTKVLMEVVAVHSAIYGLVLSMLICVVAVAVFTGHLVLLLLVVITILAMICCVVGVFALCGWEMGAVEAVSLSILVGSSVDYLVHIVEGYILAARQLPKHVLHSQPTGALRRARTSLAVRHIGVAVVCSALTTVIAAVPLTKTSIQPFAKFGAILLLNTSVSVVMTLTLAVALLALFAPGRYQSSLRSHLIALAVAGTATGLAVLAIYIAVACFGVHVPGPSGDPLFVHS